MRKTVLLVGVALLLGIVAVHYRSRPSAALPRTGQGQPNDPRPASQAPNVDLVIALDISSSMDGLINAARQKLWDIVNKVAQARPTPRLRVGLLTFGHNDHPMKDGWVVVESDLTTNLDSINAKLFALTTNGGTELVARVVQRAVTSLDWDASPGTLRQIYVAGNEPADQDQQVSLEQALGQASRKGIFVNAIYCGGSTDGDALSWRTAARLGDGLFASIDQNQTVAIATPYDDRLNQLSEQLNATYEGYGAGGARAKAAQARQDVLAKGLHKSTGAARAFAKASAVYDNSDWDIVDAKKKGKLAAIPRTALPAQLQGMSDGELQQYVGKKEAQRSAIHKQIQELSKQRDAHVASEMKRQGLSGEKSFDQAVKNALVQQAAKKKITLK